LAKLWTRECGSFALIDSSLFSGMVFVSSSMVFAALPLFRKNLVSRWSHGVRSCSGKIREFIGSWKIVHILTLTVQLLSTVLYWFCCFD